MGNSCKRVIHDNKQNNNNDWFSCLMSNSDVLSLSFSLMCYKCDISIAESSVFLCIDITDNYFPLRNATQRYTN
jgi:hypothetical protein